MSKLTVFTQIIQLIDRNLTNKVISYHKSDKHSKGFPVWSQLMCMLFCHFSNSHSIRDIVHGMCSTTGNLHHIDVRRLPRRSTLSYANQHRNWVVFRDIYLALYQRLSGSLPSPTIKFKIRSKILLLDSTIIPLSLKVFDWATFRQHKGAMKLHTLLDYQGAMPEFIHVTEGKIQDMKYAWNLTFPKGSVVVADRGYLDYALLNQWNKDLNIRFVVRTKKDMVFEIVEDNQVKHENILKDQIVRLNKYTSRKKYPGLLRRIEVWDPINKKVIVLISNQTKSWTAKPVAELYRARWQIEVFFKEVKQHLKIKSFIGTSVNAVMTQIWTAMITILLLKYLKAKAKFSWNLSNLVSFLRFNLLVSVNLFDWLDKPLITQMRGSPDDPQLTLFER